ncbi:MAG: TonB-dependent receptor [Opitutaceae bacterium]|jgi:vitamin B12 transporter|nr:TonB-dependent receptor [Opitutaceae bacterium]
MTPTHSLPRHAGRLFAIALAGFAANALTAIAPAQAVPAPFVSGVTSISASDETIQLGRYTVSASRTPQDPLYTPNSVTLVSLDDLKLAQVPDLRSALAQIPGVSVGNSGPAGGQSSVFIRGAANDHTLFIVDGVRMNDRAATYLNYLGGAGLGGLGRMEILRGPQSTLYGSSALGGVILIDTPRGCGAPAGFVAAEYGSFETLAAGAAVSGGTQVLGYSASLNRFQTANDLPENDFKHWAYTARLEYAPFADNSVLVGATFRADNGEYQEPGANPGTVDSDNYLGTLYAQYRPFDNLTSRLTLAYHERHYGWEPVIITGWETSSTQYNKRQILDWQNTWAIVPRVELVAGANYEHSNFVNNGESKKDDIYAGYLSASARPADNLVLTAGLRYDEFDSVGTAVTWRAGLALLPRKDIKIHASYGTGFNAPSPSDIYGVPSWGTTDNLNLKAEKSKGWDLGIERQFLDGRIIADITYFENRFKQLIDYYDPTPLDWSSPDAYYININHAKTSGFEISALAKITDDITVRVAYTGLEAKNTDTHARLARRPRHTADLDARWQAPASLALRGLTVGAGLHIVSDRVNDNYGGPRIEDYTTARVFASYTLGNPTNLTFKVRVENALDEDYAEVPGYPTLPLGVFAGIEWKF